MSSPARCPGCGRPDALIGLGERRDRPHRWRPWVSTVTLIYLCAQCDALVEERRQSVASAMACSSDSALPAAQAAANVASPSAACTARTARS
jgi:hypothetical protein